MKLRVLAKQAEIAKAARVLERQIKLGKPFARTLGYQGDSEDQTVYWHHRAGVWATQKRLPNRLAGFRT